MEEQGMFIFYSDASILKYSLTSSTGVSSFFFYCTRGFILGWCFTRFNRSFFL